MLVRSAVGSWRDSLIDLTAASRLLNAGPGRTGTIGVIRPSAGEVLARLAAGGTYTFRSLRPARPVPGAGAPSGPGGGPAGQAGGAAAAAPPPAVNILDAAADPENLAAALRALRRRSDQEYRERGVGVLYLAFGTLTWSDDGRTRYSSPLLLVPVRLVAAGPRQPPVLEPAGDDPVVNPALTVKLSRYGITLPRVDDLEEVSLGGLLDAVRAAVRAKDGWQVSESLMLSCFSFAREAMYRDLLDHEDLVVAHPAVAALAAGRPAGADLRLVTGELSGQPGTRAAPEAAPVILAADSAQRAAIAAALAGRSFVLDGPPGTGKSQTIANMIGALLHAGRTVLFVSGKAAALDVVRDRLTDAGLGAYLLDLHSGKAARHEVAASLGSALDTVPAVPAPVPGMDAAAVRKRREQIEAHADAMNRRRDPLGSSLQDVLTTIASLQDVPAAPATGFAPQELTAETLSDIRNSAAALAAAWRPAAQGRSFAWRDVTERGSLDTRLYQAASALEALSEMARLNQTLADVTGLTRPSGAQSLAALISHLWGWPAGLPDEWLTVDTLDAADAAVAQLAADLTAVAARESQAAQAAGIPWRAIPRSDALPVIDARAILALTPACADVSDMSEGQVSGLARTFTAHADLLARRLGSLSGLAGMLGLRAPGTFAEAADLLTLARLAVETDRPERAWLSAPGCQAASDAGRVLWEAHHALARAEADAGVYFTPDALQHDVDGLAQRFADNHHGLGKLSGEYRADKRTATVFTREEVASETALEHLGLAAAWKQAAQALAAAEASHAALLGPYYSGRATDFERLGRALTHAATAVRCARGQDLSHAAEHVARDAVPKPVITETAAETLRDLAAWQAALAPPPAAAPRPELMNGSITEAIAWLRAHLGPLHAASALTREVSEVVGRQLTFGQARQLVALREAADSAHAQLSARDAVFRELCGQLYTGVETDVRELRTALEWARRLREMITGGPGPLTQALLMAAESAVPSAQLAEAAQTWREACADLMQAFGPERRRELAAELDHYDNGAGLLEAMFNDPGGRAEWHAYQAARASLAVHGLTAAVDFCVAERVEAALVPQVIERALLQEWAGYRVRADPDLAGIRDVDLSALASEEQQLDQARLTAAAAGIIRACNARRPATGTGETAVIHREAEKKRKHLPVRVLLERARQVTQAIKPCFLMSPLTVSQYLPDGLHFDVVIIDEASQVSAAGAISCIYRGSALILAGDQQQLPPARGFGAGGPDDGEEAAGLPGDPPGSSVLDLAQGSGAYRNLPLRWHYRSRHEALIAFPNAAFYEGRLVPQAGQRGGRPDAGLELLRGEGTCRRVSQDNPDEAARVAQRVIHHCDTRPGLSLGVVTFSEAQARAVETAVGRARQNRPDLDRFFTGDRLRGFFVKTADSVQGDERDVLILSIGYGPDEDGKITVNFGPLSQEDGWRRLNVAITRARYRNEIVTSIRAADIPESVGSEGLRQLRRYLAFASALGGVR